MVKSFSDIWREISKSFSQDDIEIFYKIMPCKKNDDELTRAINSKIYSTFNYFRMGGCAENIVFPIYMLNGKSRKGDFKV